MNRVARLREFLEREGCIPFIISDLSNIYYLTGFTGSTAFLIITDTGNYFVTDGRYAIQSREEVDEDFEISVVDDYKAAFVKHLDGYKKVWLEISSTLRLFHLLKTVGFEVNILETDYVKRLRMVKDKEEIKEIKNMYLVAEKSFLSMLENICYGDSESKWAAVLEYNMKLNGARNPSFDTIVASGYRGALPHGIASSKIVQKNEPIIVDFGCKLNYCSDITRVIYNGNDDYVLKIIGIVKDALKYSVQSIKPGVKCSAVDSVAREYIESKGYGMFFNHGLGHGVGIDVHELPVFGKRDDTILEEGMVLTVEPGIYMEGEFGIRLEDTIVVTDDGCEILNELLTDYVYKL